jgi:hypothetical protein
MMIRPLGGQRPAGLSAARWLAALRVYLVFLVSINGIMEFTVPSIFYGWPPSSYGYAVGRLEGGRPYNYILSFRGEFHDQGDNVRN